MSPFVDSEESANRDRSSTLKISVADLLKGAIKDDGTPYLSDNDPPLKHIEPNKQAEFENFVDNFTEGKLNLGAAHAIPAQTAELQKLGFSDKPIALTGGVLHKTLKGKHKDDGITPAIIKQLPSALDNPLAILNNKSKDHPPGSKLAITNLQNASGDYVTVALHPDVKLGRSAIVQNIASLHPRNLRRSFGSWNFKKEFEYLNKNDFARTRQSRKFSNY